MATAMNSTGVWAQESDDPEETSLPLEVEIEGGYRYDDNITVDENDANSRQGDGSFLLKGNLGIAFVDNKKAEISGRYNFSRSYHNDLSDFDLEIHGLSFRAKTKIGKVNVAADYRYNDIALGGDGFLSIHTIRPNIGWLVAKRTYLTASYEYREHDFKELSLADRNAHRHTGASKIFFLRGKGENFTLGYKLAHHVAVSDEFSYWAHTIDTGWKKPVKLGATDAIYRLRYQYRQKDYTGINTTIGAEREDKRHTIRTSLRVPVKNSLHIDGEYKYVSSQSNLESIDYDSHVVTFSLVWSL